LESLDRDGLSLRELVRPADLDELPVRPDAVLLQVPELRLGDLPLRNGLECELDRVVPVGIGRAHGYHWAWPGLDHRDGREDAGLLVEDLRHAQLLADDALHQS